MKRIGRIMKRLIISISIAGLILVGYKGYQSAKKPNKIVLVSKSIQEEYVFWETIRMGAELAAREEEINFEYVGPLEEKDVDRQIEILDEKIEEGVDVLLLAAADEERLVPSVERAIAKGITLVSVDSSVGEDEKIVATNNVEAAKELTYYLMNSIEDKGEIIMLNFVQGTSTAKEREKGYHLAMAQQSEFIQLPTVYTEGTAESAYLKAKEIIKQYPHLKGIIGANQYMTEGICLAIQELGLSNNIKVVGFDSSDVIIEGLEKGIIHAILVQKPFNMGYVGVKVAVDLFDGKKVQQYTDTGYKLITPETLYTTENQKLLYPIIK